MLSTKAKSAQSKQTTPVSMTLPVGGWLEFAGYLARKHSITGDLISKSVPNHPGKEKKLRDLWELTDLSANDFADEIAQFHKLPRADLPQLLAASSLTEQFSHRFLRETMVFPCRVQEGTGNTLVV